MNRLFLFAGYDPRGTVRESLVYYAEALSRCGDVVFAADNDAAADELAKLAHCTLHAQADRHGEYDFGSYKRAWLWAKANLRIESYDFVYMVNDSVIGPLYDLMPYLERMESSGRDAFGLVFNPMKRGPHIQSWFIGMTRRMSLSPAFDRFITSVTHHDDMTEIYCRYEWGFTRLAAEMGLDFGGLYVVRGKRIYNRVAQLYRRGLPFFKKSAFTRHNGALGAQVEYVLAHIDQRLADAVRREVEELYGDGILTDSPLVCAFRYLKYAIGKVGKKIFWRGKYN